MLKQIEKNTINSFTLAKQDIRKLQIEVEELKTTQRRIISLLDNLKTTDIQLYKKINELALTKTKNIIVKTEETEKNQNKEFVSSKTGKSFHKTNCPFAQNIMPKNKITFKSKITALNQGYKACKCINKK